MTNAIDRPFIDRSRRGGKNTEQAREAGEYVGGLLGDLLRVVPRDQHPVALRAVAVGLVKNIHLDDDVVQVRVVARYTGEPPWEQQAP